MRLSELRFTISRMLLEHELRQGVTLYHRSHLDMEPGHVIRPNVDSKTGRHWLLTNVGEEQLEEFRAKKAPEKPSRLSSVYMTLAPHSRFSNKGHLYAVEPMGMMHVTDSRIIDRIYREARRDGGGTAYSPGRDVYVSYFDMEQYWKGVEPTKENLKDIEVLASSARVLRKIEEPNRVASGREVKLPIPVQGEIGFEINGTVQDALARLKSDGVRIIKPRDLYDPDKRPAWLHVEVELPVGYNVTPYIQYRPASEWRDAGPREEVPSFTLFDRRARKMYVLHDMGLKLLKALRKQRA